MTRLERLRAEREERRERERRESERRAKVAVAVAAVALAVALAVVWALSGGARTARADEMEARQARMWERARVEQMMREARDGE